MLIPAPQPSPDRYGVQPYRRTGRSGLDLPAVSLGLWQNFGAEVPLERIRTLLRGAFDLGITHFDLANNYGPPYGSAESQFGVAFAADLKPYRDELVLSTKAGYDMWPGPYGSPGGGSRKYLVSSLDQSLQRMGVDYVDIYYHHRPDPSTPLEETMGALDAVVRAGKALYVGVSNYSASQTRAAAAVLRDLGTPLLIHQPRYSIFDRFPERPDDSGSSVLDVLGEEGIGCITFSPLAQGMLTDRYLDGVPADSRAARNHFLKESDITPGKVEVVRALNEVASARGQSLAQMALSWVLRDERVTSVLIGASSTAQLEQNVAAAQRTDFTTDELAEIERLSKDVLV